MYNYTLATLTSKSNRNRDAGKQKIQGMFPSTSYFTSLNLILFPCFFEFLFLFNIYKQFISIFTSRENIIFLAFNDAFELFDRSGGKRLVAWTECANLARCFGYNPTNQYVLHLLGGDEIDTMPKSQLAEKTIGLDDFLPHLWTISQAPDPGCYEEFFEGLKVRI